MKALVNVVDLEDPNAFVFLDARFRLSDPDAGRSLFERGHIPGAFYLDLSADLSDTKAPGLGRHPWPSKDRVSAWISRCGISSKSKIICYDDSDHAGAARAWAVLKSFGFENAFVLNGGLKAWQSHGRPLEQGTALSAEPTVAVLNEGRSAFPIWSRSDLEHARLVDARAPERFRGEVEPIDVKAGHIPGATNCPYSSFLDSQGCLSITKAKEAGWHESSVFYCGSGVTACVLLLLSYELDLNCGLYPGSWSEWISCPDAAIETVKIEA